ncbi:MAG: efflux RND transporter periplasmic adaptor subunit [Bdellovibrio sp.]|nr:efflux RND transporter periplasmic adaptor subunit [Bdellovibrio sp.]
MKTFSNKIIFFTALAVIVAGCFFFFRSGMSTNKNEHGLGAVVKQDLVQRVTIAGTVTPLKKTIITAPYHGYVKKLFVKVGDKVNQGTPLVSVVQSLQSGDNPFPLRSPLTGTVVQIGKSEGEFVREGDPKEFILRIDDTSKLYVVANAPEIDRVKVKSGQDAVIKASAILNRKYQGVIRELSLAARDKEEWGRSQVVEFPIRIEITDSDEMLRPGMSVVIDVITAKKENILTLRHEFIHRNDEKYYVILSSGKARDIQVGLQNEESFEILSGLNEGEKVKQIDFSELNSMESI